MKRKPFIAGNWKMNTTTGEAVKLVIEMVDELTKVANVDIAICPHFISLVPIFSLVSSTRILLGAQNIHFEEKGAYTGEISAAMIKPYCQYVIIGHSERRQLFGENAKIVNLKLKKALQEEIIPILCLGETLELREAGQAEESIVAQLKSSLHDIQDIKGMVIAYEPIWAIGTGINAQADKVSHIMKVIRQAVSDLYGNTVADSLRLLYGGSVNSENAADYFSQETIDGALVGGASLKSEQFISIVQQAGKAGH